MIGGVIDELSQSSPAKANSGNHDNCLLFKSAFTAVCLCNAQSACDIQSRSSMPTSQSQSSPHPSLLTANNKSLLHDPTDAGSAPGQWWVCWHGVKAALGRDGLLAGRPSTSQVVL